MKPKADGNSVPIEELRDWKVRRPRGAIERNGPDRRWWLRRAPLFVIFGSEQRIADFLAIDMSTSSSFWLVVLALLASYLYASLILRSWLRHRAWVRGERIRSRAIEVEFPPRAFDAALVAPRMQRVRRDYVSSAHLRWPAAQLRTGLLEGTRHLVARLGYFRRARGSLLTAACEHERIAPPQ